MKAMGSPNFVPEQIETCTMSYSAVSYLKKLKNQAKVEYDRLVASVGQARPLCPGVIRVTSSTSKPSVLRRPDFHQLLARHGGDISCLSQELNASDYDSFALGVPGDCVIRPQVYINPFDISRKELLTHIRRMRVNFMKAALSGIQLQEAETLHSVSVQNMGNYQEYVKRLPPPMREIETQPSRQHTFGNPFKVNKNLMIDEADEAMPGQQSSRKRSAAESPCSPRPNKRKPGPLPKGVPVRTLLSPVREVSTPPPSPCYDAYNDTDYDDEICNDGPITIDVEDGTDLQTSEAILPVNHMLYRPNGDLDDDIDAVSVTEYAGSTVQQPPLPGSAVIRPVNGLKTHENISLLQKMAITEVKKPGKDFSELFKLLDSLDGSTEECCTCIKTVIHEAKRFKRHLLAEKLRDLLQRKLSRPSQRSANIISTAGASNALLPSASPLSRTLHAGVTVNCNHRSDAV